MELKEILKKCDHTLLAQTATWEEIRALCDDGIRYETATVCIPASFVKQAKAYVGERLGVCTVICKIIALRNITPGLFKKVHMRLCLHTFRNNLKS